MKGFGFGFQQLKGAVSLSAVAISFPYDLTVINPAADTGDLTGWDTIQGNPSVTTGPSGGGTLPRSGSHYFYIGGTSFQGEVFSNADIDFDANLFPLIDAGTLQLNIGYHMTSHSGDSAKISATFYTGLGDPIGAQGTPTGFSAVGSEPSNWQPVNTSHKIPLGARSCRLSIQARRAVGTSSDGYVEDITLSITDTSAVYPLPLNIKNGSAETGDLSNWTVTSGNVAVIGSSGDGTRPYRHLSFFYPGSTSLGQFHQDVDVPALIHSDIDAGLVKLVPEYWQSTGGTDLARIDVYFFDDGDVEIGSELGTSSSAGGANSWVQRVREINIPALTRKIRIRMHCIRALGSSNDGYTDNINAYFDLV